MNREGSRILSGYDARVSRNWITCLAPPIHWCVRDGEYMYGVVIGTRLATVKSEEEKQNEESPDTRTLFDLLE